MIHHRYQAIVDPKGANIWIFTGTRRTLYKRLAELTIPRPFTVELWHHSHSGDVMSGDYNCSLTRKCRPIVIN